MPGITIRVYEELNDHLPADKRKKPFTYRAGEGETLADILASLGVPEGEVDMALVNGYPAGLSFTPSEGDLVSLFPVFEALDVGGTTKVRPDSLRRPAFVADVHLGRLARRLRMLGFDTLYRNDYGDDTLARISLDENRILLTRDRGLAARPELLRVHLVRSANRAGQMKEVVARFDLSGAAAPFTRCMGCNGLLESVSKEAVLGKLPPKVRQRHEEFMRCPGCGKVYWKGDHYARMMEMIKEATDG